jgi:signal transduction histidine kinase
MLSMAHEITKRKRTEAKVKQTYSELNRSEKMLAKTLVDLKVTHEELKATQLQLIQAEKLESVGRLAAGVAHEVKNPLAIIQLDVDYLTNTLTNGDENIPIILQDINNAVKRADTVIKGLLNFSASREFLSEIEEFNFVVEQSLSLVKHELDRSHIYLVKELGEDLPPVRLDRNKIEQVFVNVLMNAIQAMPKGGTLTVKTYVKQFNGGCHPRGHGAEPDKLADRLRVGDTVVVAEVEDTGTGIPENQFSKIFDPFFTTKPTGKGTGLGLTVTNKIIELHGGTIDIRNRKEGGVRVEVMLKAQRRESQ